MKWEGTGNQDSRHRTYSPLAGQAVIQLHSRYRAYELISYHPTTWSLCCLSTVDDRSVLSLLSRRSLRWHQSQI